MRHTQNYSLLLVKMYKFSIKQEVDIAIQTIQWFFRLFISQTRIDGSIDSIEYTNFRCFIIDGLKQRITLQNNKTDDLKFVTNVFVSIQELLMSDLNSTIQRKLIDTIKEYTFERLEFIKQASSDFKEKKKKDSIIKMSMENPMNNIFFLMENTIYYHSKGFENS